MAQEIIPYQEFEGELAQREESFAAMLPTHIDRGRFKANAIAAVRQTPALLKCTKRSLFGAITKSAQDGLMPDGREGVINAYGSDAQWIPMTHGLRKRAKELDGIIVDAQVVYAGDHFQHRGGDDPRIDHVPAPLGTPRGEMIGAYAIFKAADGTVLHREVMDAEQINRVRSQSKQQNGLLWGKFTEEAWRKTVIRRGFKSVPCSERLQAVVHRDDDLFEFEEQPETRRAAARVVQAPPIGQHRTLPPLVGTAPRFIDPEHQAHFDAQAPTDLEQQASDEPGPDPRAEAYEAGERARENNHALRSVPGEYRDNAELAEAWGDGWRAKDAELSTRTGT